MVWSTVGKDGKPRYIKKFGDFVVLTKSRNGALDSIPEGWEVRELPNGNPKLQKIR